MFGKMQNPVREHRVTSVKQVIPPSHLELMFQGRRQGEGKSSKQRGQDVENQEKGLWVEEKGREVIWCVCVIVHVQKYWEEVGGGGECDWVSWPLEMQLS